MTRGVTTFEKYQIGGNTPRVSKTYIESNVGGHGGGMGTRTKSYAQKNEGGLVQ